MRVRKYLSPWRAAASVLACRPCWPANHLPVRFENCSQMSYRKTHDCQHVPLHSMLSRLMCPITCYIMLYIYREYIKTHTQTHIHLKRNFYQNAPLPPLTILYMYLLFYIYLYILTWFYESFLAFGSYESFLAFGSLVQWITPDETF